MRAKIGSVEIEGTPDEISALLRSLPLGTLDAPKANLLTSNGKYVSEEIAFRVLKRRPLSKEQRILLSLLVQNFPNWTNAKDLQKATKYRPSQLAGLLGAFGKRVGATEGYSAGFWFFDQEWDYEQDCNRYRLPEGVINAARRAGL
ncbi:MAG: hypothetical protein H0W66_09250 [Chthoniobacterales bacterium]|nr:hypothetical protein [Chthoniobacterales bacterium]